MRSLLKTKVARKTGKLTLFFFMALLMAQCFEIVTVDQPTTADAGEDITIKLQTQFKPKDNWPGSRVVAAILVPRSWNAADHTQISYTSSKGNGTMSLIPDTEIAPGSDGKTWPQELKAKKGIGNNYIDDMEWVAFWSEETYDAVKDEVIDGEIKIVTKVGPDNVFTQLGYFIGESTFDITSPGNFDLAFTPCFTATNGSGELVDFCTPTAAFSPSSTTDNDILTVVFNAAKGPTPLLGADKVYTCATGYVAGTPIEICAAEAKSILKSTRKDFWRLDMWPREYFGLTDTQALDSIKFSFRNEAGDILVVDPTTNEPFLYEFTCGD